MEHHEAMPKSAHRLMQEIAIFLYKKTGLHDGILVAGSSSMHSDCARASLVSNPAVTERFVLAVSDLN